MVEVGLHSSSVCLGFGTGYLMVEVAKKELIAVHVGWPLNVQIARSVVPLPSKTILAVSSDVMPVAGWVETLPCCSLNWAI